MKRIITKARRQRRPRRPRSHEESKQKVLRVILFRVFVKTRHAQEGDLMTFATESWKRVARELKDGDNDQPRHRLTTDVAKQPAAGVEIHSQLGETELLVHRVRTQPRRRSIRSHPKRGRKRHRHAGCPTAAAPTHSHGCAAGNRISPCSAVQVDAKVTRQLMNPRQDGEGHGRARWIWSPAAVASSFLIIAMEHTKKGRRHKILKMCTLPLSGSRS